MGKCVSRQPCRRRHMHACGDHVRPAALAPCLAPSSMLLVLVLLVLLLLCAAHGCRHAGRQQAGMQARCTVLPWCQQGGFPSACGAWPPPGPNTVLGGAWRRRLKREHPDPRRPTSVLNPGASWARSSVGSCVQRGAAQLRHRRQALHGMHSVLATYAWCAATVQGAA